MQQIMETLFDFAYFIITTYLGIQIIQKSNGHKSFIKMGIMSFILVIGDAFHLVPRIYALWTSGLEANAPILGIGKFITSITMTVFYVILYHIWRERYQIKARKGLTVTVYVLAILRIALCLMPQNEWLLYNSSFEWGIYRNIPFLILGIVILTIFYTEARRKKDASFRFMWLAITLSFAFYIPVVLLSDIVPIVGMLMLPKTVTYVWIIWMGYKLVNTQNLSPSLSIDML
jgi:hypothetical protein